MKTTAAYIGSAIERDRTQKAMLRAEEARSAELERHNTELQQTLAWLNQKNAFVPCLSY